MVKLRKLKTEVIITIPDDSVLRMDKDASHTFSFFTIEPFDEYETNNDGILVKLEKNDFGNIMTSLRRDGSEKSQAI